MPTGPESLLPPLVAIVLAIATRRVVLPLACGVLIGAVLLARTSPQPSIGEIPVIFGSSLWQSISDVNHLQVVAFSLLLGAMVGILELAGGMHDLIGRLAARIGSRRGAQSLIAGSGVLIFFDDYANSLLVGGTMRSPADRFGVSREKLAYLVDSTAAPIAGLSLISTWAAVEIDYIATGLSRAGIEQPTAAMTMFIQTIPYRFYAWFALATVFLVALSGRDLGAMRRCEQDAVEFRHRAGESSAQAAWGPPTPKLWLAAVVPILACVAGVLTTLVVTGLAELQDDPSASTSRWGRGVALLGSGDPYGSLIVGSAIGLSLALLLHPWLGQAKFGDLVRYGARGAGQMMPAIVILWLAWALSAMTDVDRLNTGGYLASLLSDRLTTPLLPTVVFITAGLVAFATGTSWGTMALLMPLAIELSFRLTGQIDPGDPLVLATCGSVLAGAIWGDHCSPISDTTVLSSRASGCDHMAHVRTQIPYALLGGMTAVLVGTVPAALGVSPLLCLFGGTVLLWGVLRTFGRAPLKPTA